MHFTGQSSPIWRVGSVRAGNGHLRDRQRQRWRNSLETCSRPRSGAMTTAGKATRIQLFSLSTPQMRAFHLSWFAFFVCFFAWFAVAPLMPVIKGDLGLSKDQIANINIAAVGI